MAVKNAKNVLKKMFAFVSIAVEMQAKLHMVSFLNKCFVQPIFSPFGFLYFGHFSCEIFFEVFSVLPILSCKMQTKIT